MAFKIKTLSLQDLHDWATELEGSPARYRAFTNRLKIMDNKDAVDHAQSARLSSLCNAVLRDGYGYNTNIYTPGSKLPPAMLDVMARYFAELAHASENIDVAPEDLIAALTNKTKPARGAVQVSVSSFSYMDHNYPPDWIEFTQAATDVCLRTQDALPEMLKKTRAHVKARRKKRLELPAEHNPKGLEFTLQVQIGAHPPASRRLAIPLPYTQARH
jgi:hypothetical protein